MHRRLSFLVALVAMGAIPAAGQDFSAWSTVADPTNALSVTVGAALASTSHGMAGDAADVPEGASAYVEDQTPSNESRYRARFYFRPNTLDPGVAASKFRTRVFTAIDADAPGGGTRRLVMIALRQTTVGGSYSLICRVYRGSAYVSPVDGTNYEQIGPVNLGSGATEHWVEFDWKKASTPGGTDGTFTFWLDNTGSPVANLTGIPLNDFGVDTARLGFIQILQGANGVVNLDEFESRRLTQIGPVS